MEKQHHYAVTVTWTGNQGEGTTHYRKYTRDHVITADHKPDILASSDPHFRGDHTRHNPEDLLVASLSGCHMLTYLHLCAVNGVVVTSYTDNAEGKMEETSDGGGHFTEVLLRPTVTVQNVAMIDKAKALHEKAHDLCFVARSVNFPVLHQTSIVVTEGGSESDAGKR